MNLEDVILRSTRVLQPVATTVALGTLYYVTDETVLERSNGTVWQAYSASASAGINQLTGDVTAGPGSGSQAATVATMVGDSGAGGTKGLVPAPSAGDAAADKYLKADGTFAVPPGSGGASDIFKARIVLTDAQIKALPATAVQIIAAPGATKYIDVISCTAYKNATAGAYSGTLNAGIYWVGLNDALVTALPLNLAAAEKRIFHFVQSVAVNNTSNPLNKAVEFRGAFGAALTGGNAANYCVIEVTYIIVTDGP